MGQTVDDRVPQDPAAVARAITPDYALGGHTASPGLCWLPAGTFPGFPEGMAIGQHGSWNRSTPSGYKVIFVPFANGRPAGRSVREWAMRQRLGLTTCASGAGAGHPDRGAGRAGGARRVWRGQAGILTEACVTLDDSLRERATIVTPELP